MTRHPWSYEREKARLLKRVHDDNHGITMTRDDYKDQLKHLDKARKKARKPQKRRQIEDRRKLFQRDLDEFEPQWIPYEDVKRFLEYTDSLIYDHPCPPAKTSRQYLQDDTLPQIFLATIVLISITLIILTVISA